MAAELVANTLVFEDRAQAGRVLAGHLLRFRDEKPIVLALPRGGVVVGCEVAWALDAPLDVIAARKLGAPGREEFGMGAIAPGGVRVLDEAAIAMLGITEREIERAIESETREMNRRLHLYRGDRPFPDVRGRTVILVDDGLATGVTARAAILFLRQQHPRRIVLSTPVCAKETAERMRTEVDDLVCVSIPPDFQAVGAWYLRFDQTTDQEVIDLLGSAVLDREQVDTAESADQDRSSLDSRKGTTDERERHRTP